MAIQILTVITLRGAVYTSFTELVLTHRTDPYTTFSDDVVQNRVPSNSQAPRAYNLLV